MTGTSDPITSFDRFIGTEREYFENEQNNRMAFALGQPGRYMRFLVIVKQRHDDIQAQVVAAGNARLADARDRPGTRRVDPVEAESWAEAFDSQTRLHLEIETFFDMAYVGLTKAAQFIGWYFTNEMVFESHAEFTKRGLKYCGTNDLKVPDGLFSAAEAVLNGVTEPRSHQIVHNFMPAAAHGTAWGPDGYVSRSTGRLYPVEGSSQPPTLPTVDAAYILIGNYIEKFTEFVSMNRTHGKFNAEILDQPGRPLFERLMDPEG